MGHSKFLLSAILVSFCLAGPVPKALAGVTFTGDYSPAPVSWNASTDGYVGRSAAGTVSITNGSALNSSGGYLGYNAAAIGLAALDGTGSIWTNTGAVEVGVYGNGILNIANGGTFNSFAGFIGADPGSMGVVTVTGSGSAWNNNNTLFVGAFGDGTLNITNGATVTNTYNIQVGSGGLGSTGTINFGPGGGTLTTGSLYASPTQLTGTGTINTTGLVGDMNLVFDSAHGANQTFTLNQSGQRITVNLNVSNPGNWGDLGAGYLGNGSLLIQNGVTTTSYNGYLGYSPGSMGVATLTGAGSTWNVAALLYVGNCGNGTLNITGGATTSSYVGEIGYLSGTTGVVTVDGAGSTWSVGDADVGYLGSGTLNITNGATVTNTYNIRVGSGGLGSTGTINFGAGGGTLTTESLYASPTQLTGTGTINTRGLVSDMNLSFDSTHGLSQTVAAFGMIAVNLDMSDPNNVGDLGAGWNGNGSLTVRDGIVVNCGQGYLGNKAGSTGTAAVDGPGSTWNSDTLWIGYMGSGMLNIANGANVTSRYVGCIGSSPGSTGVVTVAGTGSIWTNYTSLLVGDEGSGTLKISGGGAVTATGVWIGNRQSLLAIDVGRGSSLGIGGGTITNNGTIRILAGAAVSAGNTYTSISAGKWSGSGTYQAVGGTWNTSNHAFTASTVQTGTSGTAILINLLNKQRVLISDSSTGCLVGASFLAKPTSTPLNFTATAMGSDSLDSLGGLLAPGQSVLGGWNFLADAGYTPGDPAYLSFGVGSGHSSDCLEVWHFDGTNWTEFAANDLTYDGNYASFTVTGLSGYAVTGMAVPEPGTLALLVAGLLSVLAYVSRKRN